VGGGLRLVRRIPESTAPATSCALPSTGRVVVSRGSAVSLASRDGPHLPPWLSFTDRIVWLVCVPVPKNLKEIPKWWPSCVRWAVGGGLRLVRRMPESTAPATSCALPSTGRVVISRGSAVSLASGDGPHVRPWLSFTDRIVIFALSVTCVADVADVADNVTRRWAVETSTPDTMRSR